MALYIATGLIALFALVFISCQELLGHGRLTPLAAISIAAASGIVFCGIWAAFQKWRRCGRVAGVFGCGDTLDNLIDCMPCMLTVISPDYEILWTNKKVEDLVGFKVEELVGSQCYTLLGNGTVCEGCPVQRAIASGEVCYNLKRETVASGREIVVEQTAIPVFKDNKEIKYVIEFVLDATKKTVLEQENRELFIQTVEALIRLIDKRDTATGKHSAAVEQIALEIGRELELDTAVLDEIAVAALLHDIGKIGIPESILNKPGKLSDTEFAVIKSHSEIGYHTIVTVKPLSKVAEYVRYHHERFDGKGYPDGKSGNDIPLVSRILCVADVYEAITADRVYRPAMLKEQALETMVSGRGTLFDPQVLDAFLAVLARVDQQAATILTKLGK